MKKLLIAFALSLAINLQAGDRTHLRAHEAKLPEGNDHFGIMDDGESIHFHSNGAVEWEVSVKKAGKHRLVVIASCTDAKGEFAAFQVSVNGKAVGKPTTLKSTDRDDHGVDIELPKGRVKIKVGFTNDLYADGEYDRNLYVHKVVLNAP
ncbi:MAG: carbohydrate-binding domain-containing protein [Limisphaerales bacterium]